MESWLTFWLACVGLVIGSFLNVVIARLPAEESVIWPRSRCPACFHALSWYENIPLLSWLALRGRCRACRCRISIQYPMVEALTALLFLGCKARFGLNYELLPALVLISLLIPLVFIDAQHWILPLELTVTGMVLGVLTAIPQGRERVEDALFGLFLGFVVFRLVEFAGFKVFHKEALGAGDKFLMAMVVAFLTPSAFLGVMLLSSVQASLFGLLRLGFVSRPESKAVEETSAQDSTPTLQWEFSKSGLTFWQRLVRIPYALLLQPIPDEPATTEETGLAEADAWKPGPTHIPFGPWIALAAVEILLLGPWLGEHFPILKQSGLFFGNV